MPYYEMYDIEKLEWQERISRDMNLYRIFRRQIDLTKKINNEIHKRLNDKERPNWLVIQITGDTGSMKSSTGHYPSVYWETYMTLRNEQ